MCHFRLHADQTFFRFTIRIWMIVRLVLLDQSWNLEMQQGSVLASWGLAMQCVVVSSSLIASKHIKYCLANCVAWSVGLRGDFISPAVSSSSPNCICLILIQQGTHHYDRNCRVVQVLWPILWLGSFSLSHRAHRLNSLITMFFRKTCMPHVHSSNPLL